MSTDMEQVPGFLFFDHVAISVKPGELESNVKAYEAMGCFCGPRPLTQRRTSGERMNAIVRLVRLRDSGTCSDRRPKGNDNC
jgi:hypothetical protein